MTIEKCIGDGGTCGLGGYCEECPHTKPADLSILLSVSLYPMQRKKIAQLVSGGGLVNECLVHVDVPGKGRCTVDRHGRVVWND